MREERSLVTDAISESTHNQYAPSTMVSSSWIALVAVCACVATVSSDRAYPLGCSQQPPTYYNYDSYPFPPPGTLIGSTNDYLLLRRLGSGKFSDVFEAVDVRRDKALVINGMKTSEIDPRTLVVLKVGCEEGLFHNVVPFDCCSFFLSTTSV